MRRIAFTAAFFFAGVFLLAACGASGSTTHPLTDGDAESLADGDMDSPADGDTSAEDDADDIDDLDMGETLDSEVDTLADDDMDSLEGGEASVEDDTDTVEALDNDDETGVDADTLPETPVCYGPPPNDELPDQVYFRTAKQSFNKQWYVALKDGCIYFKPNELMGQAPGQWQKVGSTGLPSGINIVRYPAPTTIVEISADGTWLHALSDRGVFYRGTNFEDNPGGLLFSWTDKWGHPSGEGSGMVQEWPTTHGWSVSDSQPPGVREYTDANGSVHSVGNGVAHLYRLGPEGRTIFYNDWWLPNDWSRQFCLPNQGTFTAENLSVSGSTTFIISRQGEMYTRLWDFDTGGEDDLLEYSYIKSNDKVRFLPAEPWQRQPDITDGLITRTITIFQTGIGNAARGLRVEGVKDGVTGFFHKNIYDAQWSFQETGLSVCGPFMNAPAEPPSAPAGIHMRGNLSHNGTLEIELLDFDMVCSPARLRFYHDGALVTALGRPIELQFHHVFGMSGPALTMPVRPTEFWLTGAPALIRAAIIPPSADTLQTLDDAGARAAISQFFGSKAVINFKGSATLTRIQMEEISWMDLIGLCPGDEKSDMFSGPYLLDVSATP